MLAEGKLESANYQCACQHPEQLTLQAKKASSSSCSCKYAVGRAVVTAEQPTQLLTNCLHMLVQRGRDIGETHNRALMSRI